MTSISDATSRSAIPTAARAAIWIDYSTVEVHDVPVTPPGPGEVLVRVRACGICGSDLHAFHIGTRRNGPGLGPGHEMAGEVVALGAGVEGPAVGTRVAPLAGRVCGKCEYCRGGRFVLCNDLRIAGASYEGGMAQYFLAQSPYLYLIPDGLSWEAAALSEPCAVSVHGLKLAGFQSGQNVLVLGSGIIGLFAVLAARDGGAARIGVTARYPHQAEAARSLGATDVFDPSEVGPGSPAAAGNWDVVVETVGGSAPTLHQAVDAVAKGGTVVVLGVFTQPPTMPPLPLILKEVRILGSFGYDSVGPRADYDDALDLLARYKDLVTPLVTHTYSLDQANDAFATALDKNTGAIKVTVLP